MAWPPDRSKHQHKDARPLLRCVHTKSNARSSWKQLEKFLNVENWAVLVTLPTLLSCWPVVLNARQLVLCLLVTLWTLVDGPAVSVHHGLKIVEH